jgi:hypothetical protein
MRMLIGAVYIAILLIGMVSIFMSIYHLSRTLNNIRPQRRMLANFIAPFVLIIPGMFSNEGNKHRFWFAIYAMLSLSAVGILIVLKAVLATY